MKGPQAMAKNDRYVVKRPDGWAVTGPGHERASGIFENQHLAEQRAKEIVTHLGGGEVRIQDRHGRWRDSDTVAPGHDSHPPIDMKH
jgi:hypothetical protein